ncbi:MAG: hypothetical protein AVDCRST_MAG73-4092, partial [uncultured Thermomicrobiales bacterium]
ASWRRIRRRCRRTGAPSCQAILAPSLPEDGDSADADTGTGSRARSLATRAGVIPLGFARHHAAGAGRRRV